MGGAGPAGGENGGGELIQVFVGGGDTLSAALIDHTGIVATGSIGRWSDVLPRAERLRAALMAPVGRAGRASALAEFAESWGPGLLLEPERVAASDGLVVVPTGPLHGLPFGVVHLPGRGPAGLAVGVALVPSLSRFVLCTARNPRRRPPALAGPPTSALSLATDVRHRQGDRFADVARRFADHFAQADHPERFTRLHIIGGLRELDERAAVCLVCHGMMDATDPTRSGLLIEPLLSGRTDVPVPLPGGHTGFAPERSRLVAVDDSYEADVVGFDEMGVRMPVAASLVAIYACMSTASARGPGDVPASLGYSALQLGAPSVLANLWTVGIDVVEQFNDRFLDAWVRDRSTTLAAHRRGLGHVADELGVSAYDRWGPLSLLGDVA